MVRIKTTEEKSLSKQRDMLVVKHNDLIQKSRYNLTANQQKLIAYVISLIKPTDKVLQKYDINVADFCTLCGIDKNHFYSEFKEIVDDLDNKAIWVKTETSVFKFRWFLKVEYIYKKGKVRVLLDDYIKQYLIDLQKNFTNYEIYNILALKSKYSIRLYEIFKSYEFQHYKTIPIDELKELLCATNYVNFKDFRNRVLERAIDEINFYTDINVSYDTETKGRKVIAIQFHIKKKESLDNYASYLNTIEEINKRNKQVKGQMSLFDKKEEDFRDENS